MRYYEFKKEDAYEFVRAAGIQSKQRGDELQLLSCPYCRGGKNGDKGTFSISLVTGQFKCLRSSCSVSGNMVTLARDFDYFSLGKDIDAYYRTGKQKRFRQFKKMEPIKPKPEAVAYLESRKITAATAEKYHITVQSKHENILVFPFLDEKGDMQFIKYRKTDFNPTVDKGKEWCEANCKPILFGMYQCNLDNKTLILTEGQLDSLGKAFIAVKIADITGIGSLVKFLVTTIGKKLIAEESVQTLAGNISNLTNGALAGSTSGIATFASSLGSLVGTAGAITLVTAGTVMLTKKIAELVETAQGGNGILTQTGGYLHDYAGKMGEAHAITNKQVEELWALVEADEIAGKSNSEMYDSMVQKLGEYGVSAEKATQILEQYGAQAGVSSAFVEEMTGKVQALGKGFSESSSTIDTSSITVKESIRGIRSVLYDLSVSSSEYAGTYRGVLEVFNNTSGSAANAQDAFNIVYNALKETGVPLDELNKKLAQEFPSAAQATKSSVDSSIVEAQKTVSSSTGKMKTDAETNLAGVKKAAEDASGSVNTTTVTNWGNSASEVKKNLDKMKQTANLKLGEMQKTVESHFSGQYNTMTKKWEKACERIGQLITQMVRSTKDSLNGHRLFLCIGKYH